jgi:integrase
MDRFVADQRHREREGLPSLAVTRPGGAASTVTVTTRSIVFNYARKLLRDALENGAADRLGLDREFIIAIPTAGATTGRTPRRPFSDEVARALADEANLAELSAKYDVNDGGVRDIWEATVITGRRIGEVIKLRWDCIGRYGGLAMFWHDQTKVGNYDAAIRIPERLYGRLAERQCKTLDRFTARYGYRPDGEQRARLALFPTIYRSQDGTVPLTHQWFYSRFRPWVDEMDLGHCVPHQARHTLATNLLRNGATLTHIRRYLGQVSDRMAEHYVNICPTLTSKTSCSRSGSPVPARPIPGSCWPAKPPRSAGNRPSPWRSTCPGAAPRPRAGSAPSSPSSTEVPVRGI